MTSSEHGRYTSALAVTRQERGEGCILGWLSRGRVVVCTYAAGRVIDLRPLGPAYVIHKAGHEFGDMKPGVAREGNSRADSERFMPANVHDYRDFLAVYVRCTYLCAVYRGIGRITTISIPRARFLLVYHR